MEKDLKQLSKFLSFILRHRPEEIGVSLNENGWANVDELIEKSSAKGIRLNAETLGVIVATNNKKRFSFNEDKTLIRANQGHSIEVDLELQESPPPPILYHGTAAGNLESILASGLKKQNRQHVHLSATIDTAKAVGSRHGKPVILTILAAAMHEKGFKFFLSENNVWLTEKVPVQYITQ